MSSFYFCEKKLLISERKTGYKLSLVGPIAVGSILGVIIPLNFLVPSLFDVSAIDASILTEDTIFEILLLLLFCAGFSAIIGFIYALIYWDAIIFNKEGIELITLSNKREFKWNEIKKFSIIHSVKDNRDPDTGDYYTSKYIEISIETIDGRKDSLIVAKSNGTKVLNRLLPYLKNEAEITETVSKRGSIQKYKWIVK